MSKLTEEIVYFSELFDNLQSTNSRIEKLEYIRQMPEEYKASWEFILECLDGKHPFGYKVDIYNNTSFMCAFEAKSVKELLQWLLKPIEKHDLSQDRINYHLSALSLTQACFVEPIVNRTLKLGIGRSLLPLSETSPMLAKKFDDKTYDKLNKNDVYYLTEKLDGNRCIAYHDGIEWNFVSRNGKPMYVKFDMSQFPESMIFDGEVMSIPQTNGSVLRHMSVKEDDLEKALKSSTADFTLTSGTINTHTLDKELVYNIFDIVDNFSTYQQRRSILSQFKNTKDVRILPVIDVVTHENLFSYASKYLDNITYQGGEGIMINAASAKYQHKRVSDLLKFKKVYTMDMKVVEVLAGTGKYLGQVGALSCMAEDTENGRVVSCNVGTGLSDEQRLVWSYKPSDILGKTVEVAYFSLSQDKSLQGTSYYSLRFPRLMRVRKDKSDTNLEV